MIERFVVIANDDNVACQIAWTIYYILKPAGFDCTLDAHISPVL